MTGMASYGAVHKDDEIWSLVAFVQRLPNMTPEQYKQMEADPARAAGAALMGIAPTTCGQGPRCGTPPWTWYSSACSQATPPGPSSTFRSRCPALASDLVPHECPCGYLVADVKDVRATIVCRVVAGPHHASRLGWSAELERALYACARMRVGVS
jgi:hypothetical protein